MWKVRHDNNTRHHAAVGAATLDRLGVARQATGKTSTLLITMGAAPAIAHRWLRIGNAHACLCRFNRRTMTLDDRAAA